MNASRPPIVDPDKIREEISAYLDGELSAEDGREVEERLAAEPRFRDELQGLDRAWRLLDELPRAEAHDGFASTTVEMVAVQAADDLKKQREEWPRQFLRGWVVSAGSVLAALLLGFGVVAGGAALLTKAGLVQDPNARLLADLSVVENIDHYRPIDNIDTLRQLADSGLFRGDAPGTDVNVKVLQMADVGETETERKAYVEQLSAHKKQELAEKQVLLSAMPRDSQERLRSLDRQLAEDPRADELREVLARYVAWLNTLSSKLRDDLQGMAPVQRIARIQQIRRQEQESLDRQLQQVRQQVQQELARQPLPKDWRVTMDWLRQMAEARAGELAKQMPLGARQEGRMDEPYVRRTRLMMELVQRWQGANFGKNPDVSPEEFDRLKQRLNPALVQRMNQQGDNLPAQWAVLTAALKDEVKSRLSADKWRRFEGAPPTMQWSLLMKMMAESTAEPFGAPRDFRGGPGGPGGPHFDRHGPPRRGGDSGGGFGGPSGPQGDGRGPDRRPDGPGFDRQSLERGGPGGRGPGSPDDRGGPGPAGPDGRPPERDPGDGPPPPPTGSQP